MLVRADKDGAEKLGNVVAADGTAPGNIAETAAAAVGVREFAVGLTLGFNSELNGEFAPALGASLVGEVPPLDPVAVVPAAGANPCSKV